MSRSNRGDVRAPAHGFESPKSKDKRCCRNCASVRREFEGSFGVGPVFWTCTENEARVKPTGCCSRFYNPEDDE